MNTHAYCTGCHSEVRTYVPKGKEELHYMRHYLDPLAPVGERDRCLMGGKPVPPKKEETPDVAPVVEVMKSVQQVAEAVTGALAGISRAMTPPPPLNRAQRRAQRFGHHKVHG